LFYTQAVDAFHKLSLATCQANLEADGEPSAFRPAPAPDRSSGLTASQVTRRYGDPASWFADLDGYTIPLHMAIMPGGHRLPLLKSMLTTACERNCLYCGFRAGCDPQRVTFQPDEMAHLFLGLHQRGVAHGLFLSSGVVGGGARAQDKLIDTAEVLRRKLGYRGYVHLKIMPGAERDQVVRAMQLADRVSINLEAPSPAHLMRLAPLKRFDDELLAGLRWAEEVRQTLPASMAWRGRWPSTTTQFVVGPAGESDLDLLALTSRLTHHLGLSRAYFEAFGPHPGTPLEAVRPEDPLRAHRLYQASFLLRDYGFDLEELAFDPSGSLARHTDPKLAYAQAALAAAPVELNRAPREQLLRVPGIGPRTADALLTARRQQSLRSLDQLHRLGVIAERAAPYITLDGHAPRRQLPLPMEHPTT
jgi:predicted DNA-binding helix-hairpin-helix protein